MCMAENEDHTHAAWTVLVVIPAACSIDLARLSTPGKVEDEAAADSHSQETRRL